MLYFLQEIDPPFRIKIGFSANPNKRVATIASNLPQKVQVLKIIEGDRVDESWVHEHLKGSRVEGKREWYYPTSEILEYLNCENTLSEQ